MFNNIMVWLRLQKRIGVIIEATPIDTSFIMGGGICVQSRIDEIEYQYKWCWPWDKSPNAKIKKTPFNKHSNPNCKEGK